MNYNPVGVGELDLDTLVLDLNGTLAVHGKLVNGVKPRLKKLKAMGFKLYLFTGDQRGNAEVLANEVGLLVQKATTMEEKKALSEKLDGSKTVAIGNARIDIGTFIPAKIKIATLQAEGIHAEILKYVDIIVPSINDALDMLIDPNTFNATMRK